MERTNIPYLSLNPDIEAAIRADRAAGRAHPHRFDDANVVRRERNPHDNATLTRPAFARDIEKILNVPAYNRYADKTQVFSWRTTTSVAAGCTCSWSAAWPAASDRCWG